MHLRPGTANGIDQADIAEVPARCFVIGAFEKLLRVSTASLPGGAYVREALWLRPSPPVPLSHAAPFALSHGTNVRPMSHTPTPGAPYAQAVLVGASHSARMLVNTRGPITHGDYAFLLSRIPFLRKNSISVQKRGKSKWPH